MRTYSSLLLFYYCIRYLWYEEQSACGTKNTLKRFGQTYQIDAG